MSVSDSNDGTSDGKPNIPTDIEAPPRTMLETPHLGPETVLDQESQSTDRATPHNSSETPGTIMEPSGGPGSTRLEGSEVNESRNQAILPQVLVDEGYTYVEEISRDGGEADVYLVKGADGSNEALKIWRRDDKEMDAKVEDGLKHSNYEHVVRRHRDGVDGRKRWELLEYLSIGSLKNYFEQSSGEPDLNFIEDMLKELTTAVTHFHNSLDLIHRDIKPDNILIRTMMPLDLVLTDFGLATGAASHIVMRSTHRTPAYAPPEASGGAVSKAWDWWAIGMILVEALAGEHPFQAADRSWWTDAEIALHLTTKPIPVTRITDERWRLLCRGLLVRSPDKRWNETQVNAWLEGESPEIFDEEEIEARKAYFFKESSYFSPKELANLFAGNWRDAARLLGDDNEANKLAAWLKDCNQSRAAEIALDKKLPSLNYRLCKLIYSLDPSLAPVFLDRSIDKLGIEQLCKSVIEQNGTGHDAQTLTELFQFSALELIPKQRDGLDYDKVMRGWTRTVGHFEQILKTDVPEEISNAVTDEQYNSIYAQILLASLNKDFAQDIQERARDHKNALSSIEWYQTLGSKKSGKDQSVESAILLILLSARAETEYGEGPQRPRISQFSVHPPTTIAGSFVTVSWNVEHVTKVLLKQQNREMKLGASGTLRVPVDASTIFSVEAENSQGTARADSEVVVLKMPPMQMPVIPLPRQNLTLVIGDSLSAIAHLPTPFAEMPPLLFLETGTENLCSVEDPFTAPVIPSIPRIASRIPNIFGRNRDRNIER